MNAMRHLRQNLRLFTVYPILPTLFYTLIKRFYDWQYTRVLKKKFSPKPPGPFISLDKEQNSFRFTFTNSQLEVCFIAEDIVRVSWLPGEPPIPYAIVKKDWQPVPCSLTEKRNEWVLSSSAINLSVRLDGSLEFRNQDGKVLRSSLPPQYALNNHGQVIQWVDRAKEEKQAAYYGLGERAAPLNLRGQSYRMWNTDPKGNYSTGKDPLYICIPTYISLHSRGGYLIFYENSYPAWFSFKEEPIENHPCIETQFEGGMLRYYFIPTPLERALQRYTELTGRPPLPPKWALGYHQSRWGYKSQSEITEIVNQFKQYDLPLSAVHLDIDYMEGYRVFTINQNAFPDLKALSSELLNQGVHLVTIIDPAVKCDPNYFLFLDGLKKNCFCSLPNGFLLKAPVWAGWSAFPDFTDPEVRSWWGDHYAKWLDLGVSGFWHDMNEPSAFTLTGDLTLPLQTRHALEGQKGNHLQAHNLYGLLMNRAGYEALRRHRPDKRPWLLSRSGWAGVGRYAWCWTGDCESSWQSLRQTIPTTLGMGLSGIPFSGPDIGGFSGSPTPELYLRWFQMAAFLPFFRTHSAFETPPREPWRFDEKTLEIIKKFLRIRYQLIPYLYTLAWESTQTGFPLIRPLFWVQESEPDFWSVDDEFLLGKDILVAPIVTEGATSRRVKIPNGKWFDYWTEEKFIGPTEIEIPSFLDTIPVYIRASSILPLQVERNLQLHVYPDDFGKGLLFSDEGDGYGEWRLDEFSYLYENGKLVIRHQYSGDFPIPYHQIEIHIHGMDCHYAWIDERECPIEDNKIQLQQFFQTLRIEGTLIK